MHGNLLTPEHLLEYLKQRTKEDWLIGYDSQNFYLLVEQFLIQLTQLSKEKKSPNILIAEEDPYQFLAALLAAVAANCHVFLCNRDWQQQEWQQVFDLVQPNSILGKSLFIPSSSSLNLHKRQMTDDRGQKIMIPTGGSSGKIRFTIHTWETLTASVKGFCQYFNIDSVNSFCILPLYHVSGLMQFIRSFLTKGNLAILPYKALRAGEKVNINFSDFFISLVPTQLQFLLRSQPDWLSQFYTVLLGGAPAWQSLLETARKYRIKLAPTYGMTETASQIVTLKPEAFLSDNHSSGQVLPHAKVTICSDCNERLEPKQTGIITVEAESLFLGYYPEIARDRKSFQTDDLGYFDEKGNLYIIGRSSQKIITGGENVFPKEVEAAILATQLVTDVAVIGLSDCQWGQVVTAIYVPKQKSLSSKELKIAIADKIAKFKQPKYWIPVENIPRNQQGKVNYQQLQQIATNQLGH
ncbi:MAG: 2-succinylbenzoate--CoA ligase [Hydrococcus sp. C42_A2020_068]|uniref:2-succinylbenzoate--CoA ligase n=1 Tax=Pleurocapsa sp. PCC 7327 TaxID=118163 RepID=UPI00029FA819|nr:2-succinylbenzoate--CoA ligase [Pleurocapsa sp. PCC 7327]AFY77356.1 acyl-CoA synthetase (AMP-forming)/AMP-acid ligase II [Pleurocapsa sp. PCC 7327]MBF2020619.1 2-succinylbenzoate--CoA ligase [Hydrococcus sp. C42_A2020_068]